jgi:anti-sigma-K factor RskA
LVVDSLPLAVTETEPSAALKEQLFARIQEKPEMVTAVTPQGNTSSISFGQKIHNWLAGPIWRPLAVGLVVLVFILSFFLWQQASFNNSIQFDQFVMTNTEAAPEATGLIIIDKAGNFGTLVVDKLPQLAEEEQYQLWLVKDGVRISGGVFSVYETGYQSIKIHAPDPLASYTSFGITIEPEGGSDGPTGARVLLGFNS